MKKVDVELSEKAQVGSNEITKVVLREPTTRDFFEFGECMLLTQTDNGTTVVVQNHDVIMKYIRRCMVEPSGHLDFIDGLPLTDAMRLKGAVLNFFEVARNDGSTTLEKSSSANSSGSTEETSSTSPSPNVTGG